MKNKTLIPDLELSLCPKCASVYYNDRNYYTILQQAVITQCSWRNWRCATQAAIREQR